MTADYRVKSRQGTPLRMRQRREVGRTLDSKKCPKAWDRPEKIGCGRRFGRWRVAAATGTVPGLEEDGEDAPVSSKPNALVLFNPVYDNGPKGYGHDRVKDRWKEISPMHNIRKGVPPAIVFLGDQDKLIPVSTAKKFKALMEKAGSRSDLHVYEDQPHGFFNQGKKGNYYEKTVLEMDKFLISLGWLKGKPTIKLP